MLHFLKHCTAVSMLKRMGGKFRDIASFSTFSVVASSGTGSLALFSPRYQHLHLFVGLLPVSQNLSGKDQLTNICRQSSGQQPFWHVDWFRPLTNYI